jgi:small subunit ribosomal protein S31
LNFIGVYKNCLLTHLGIDDGYNSLLKKGVKEVSLYNKAKPFNNLFELHCRRSFVYLTLKFPLDNFAFVCEGFERFEGHTFIGKYLSNALIPMKGPIRHFIQMVVIGLSNNPCYTPIEKKKHIDWYIHFLRKFPAEEL